MASDSTFLTLINEPKGLALAVQPAMIIAAGPAAGFAWDEFFSGQIRNRYTRAAYLHAVRKVLAWVEPHTPSLDRVTPGMIGAYLGQHPGSPPTRNLHLSALRRFF